MVANGSLQWPIGVSIVVSLEYLIHPSPGYCGTIPVSIRSTIRPAYHIIVDIRGALTRWLAGPRSGHAKPLRYYQPTPPLASVECDVIHSLGKPIMVLPWNKSGVPNDRNLTCVTTKPYHDSNFAVRLGQSLTKNACLEKLTLAKFDMNPSVA
jgi:hypothetical protein